MREKENVTPIREERKASFFRRNLIVREGGVIIKVIKNQPEIIVPRAKRFKAFTNFWFSSLVGESGEKDGYLKKQKITIRIEYAEVRRVATKAIVIPIRLDNVVRLNSKIKSFE